MVVLAFVIFLSVSSGKFLTGANIMNILVQASPLLIVAIGMTFTIMTRGIDMSVGSVVFLSACVGSFLLSSGVGVVWACVGILAVGVLAGLVNGYVIAAFNVYPLLTTLAMLYAARGLGLNTIDGSLKILPPEIRFIASGNILSVPIPIIIALLVLIISHIVLLKTPFGRQVYAVGNDEKVAKEVGIPVFKIKVMVYAISGLLAGVAALVWVSQLMAVSPGMGKDLEFMAIICAVLGGVSLFGGEGKVFPGVFLGTLMVIILSNGLVVIGASPYIYPIVQGGVIFLAVLADTLKYRMSRANLKLN